MLIHSSCCPQVYYISKGTLKIANKQFCTLKNDYEMTLNGETTISPCEDSQDVPMVQCDFVSIADLESREKDAIVGERIPRPVRLASSVTSILIINCDGDSIVALRNKCVETQEVVVIITLMMNAILIMLMTVMAYGTD